MRPVTLWLLLLVLSSATGVAQAQGKSKKKTEASREAAASALVVGGGALIEAGRFDQSVRVNRITNRESDDLRDFGGALILSYLHGVTPGFRIGGSLAYSGFHELSVRDSNQSRSFGQRLALDFVGEGIIPVTDRMDLLLGGRVGTPILIPGGDFKDIITVAQNQLYRTNSGPRFGLRIGFDADVRIHLKPHFAVRAGLGYAWTRTWLMNSSVESESSSGRRKYSLTLSQVRLGAGLEWLF